MHMNEQSLLQTLFDLDIAIAKINRRGGWVDFRCPLSEWTHTQGIDRKPSAGARIEPNKASTWHCYTCKNHGSISSLAVILGARRRRNYTALIERIDEVDTSAGLLPVFGRFEDTHAEARLPEPLEEAVYDGLWPNAWDEEQSREYLLSRNISAATSATIGLVFDTIERRILFPIRDREGRLFGFSGRAVQPDGYPKVKDYFGLPKQDMVLGAHLWIDGRRTIIVEGLFGYAHMVELGVHNDTNVGALLGSSMTQEKANIVIANDGTTMLLLDNDLAGDAGTFGLQREGYREQNGAVTKLQSHVPILVPCWPTWETDGIHVGGVHLEGDDKTDPDQLTRDEVDAMWDETMLYGLERL